VDVVGLGIFGGPVRSNVQVGPRFHGGPGSRVREGGVFFGLFHRPGPNGGKPTAVLLTPSLHADDQVMQEGCESEERVDDPIHSDG